MKDFFLKISNNEIYQRLFKNPFTYVGGAVMLAFFNVLTFAFTGNGWGVTGAFANWAVWALQPFGLDVSSWPSFASEAAQKTLAGGFLADGTSVRNLGIILGALLATLLASQFKIKKIKSIRQVVAAVIGGLLMGYGARLANGCNIGALFSGTSSLSVSGWVFAATLLVGAYIGSKLLKKFFM